jgi:hypothetical protein
MTGMQLEPCVLTADDNVYNPTRKPVKDMTPVGGLQILTLMLGYHCSEPKHVRDGAKTHTTIQAFGGHRCINRKISLGMKFFCQNEMI